MHEHLLSIQREIGNLIAEESLNLMSSSVFLRTSDVSDASGSAPDSASVAEDIKDSIHLLSRTLDERISFKEISHGHRVLFLQISPESPHDSSRLPIFMAYNDGCPNRFLNPTIVEELPDPKPLSVTGKVVYDSVEVAEEGNNPFGLLLGTEFHSLLIEVDRSSVHSGKK